MVFKVLLVGTDHKPLELTSTAPSLKDLRATLKIVYPEHEIVAVYDVD